MRERLSAVLLHKGRKVHTTSRETTIARAVQIMVDERIGSLLVLERERPVGIFTERDALTRVLHMRRDPLRTLISEVMTPNPLIVSPATTVEEAMMIMTERRIRRLPVVADGKVIGLISIGDLTKWVTRDNEQLIEYITGTYPG